MHKVEKIDSLPPVDPSPGFNSYQLMVNFFSSITPLTFLLLCTRYFLSKTQTSFQLLKNDTSITPKN